MILSRLVDSFSWLIVEQKPGCTIATYGHTHNFVDLVQWLIVLNRKLEPEINGLVFCIETMLIDLVACLLTFLWSPWLGGTKVNTFLVDFYNSSTGVWNVFV